ncbi:YceD family protein [Agaribacterium sp. ZY112]|uniref:YceD family protein n=1 Tax=Agaribacterium sp. ZY112 TaxID=3233574 RepID=UPI003525D102
MLESGLNRIRSFDSQGLFLYYRAPMSEQAQDLYLPRAVEPRKLATAQAAFERSIRASDLPRLAELSLSIDKVDVKLQFDRNDQGRPELQGSIAACVQLECQRCLESMSLNIERDFLLGIVWDEAQANALPKHIEPWIVGEDETDLIEIVEEEILLNIPVVARHDEDCLNPDLLSVGEIDEEISEPKENPFSVLAGLKGKH